jgi:hypothetical protein
MRDPSRDVTSDRFTGSWRLSRRRINVTVIYVSVLRRSGSKNNIVLTNEMSISPKQ